MIVKSTPIVALSFILIAFFSCNNQSGNHTFSANDTSIVKAAVLNSKCGKITFPLRMKKALNESPSLEHLPYYTFGDFSCFISDRYGAFVINDTTSNGECVFAFKRNEKNVNIDSIIIDQSDIVFISDSIESQFLFNISSRYLVLDYGTAPGIRDTRIIDLEHPDKILVKFERVDDSETIEFFGDSITYLKYLRDAKKEDDPKTYSEFVDHVGIQPVLLEKRGMNLKTLKDFSLNKISWTGFQ